MKISIIRATLAEKLNEYAAIHGENADLTPAVNTNLTDELAQKLETVNPTHDYPPVAR